MSKHVIGQLFEENYGSFKQYLRNHYQSLNDYDVEDVIQHTILKLLSKDDDFLGISNLTSYVYSSLSNSAKDYFKKHSRLEIHEEYSEHFTKLESPSAEDMILLKELKNLIKETLKSMPVKQRYVFIESEIRGKSYKTLMKETGDKLGTLLSRKNRAKKKLQSVVYNYLTANKGAI